MVILVESR